MKVALYPFASTDSITQNLAKIEKGIKEASMAQADLIAFHECALCGYPPMETLMSSINPDDILQAITHVQELAKKYNIHVALGTIRFENKNAYNSIILINDQGHILGSYDKKALWGWDCDHFKPGNHLGIFDIKGYRVAFRICFDIRFPEVFRELFQKADLCIVGFSDTSKEANDIRYQLIKSHILTRAVENAMPMMTTNTLSSFMTAPISYVGRSGQVMVEETQEEKLIVIPLIEEPITFGMKGIIENTKRLMKNNQE